jgi:5-methylcytosine-specific restriction enzyme B
MADLHPILRSDLLQVLDQVRTDEPKRNQANVQRYLETFRRRFGPDVLRSMNGSELLELMHDHGNRGSLVYWLEFKDDEEFPAIFGSIAGGSALKFGIYRRKESQAWATKGKGNAPKDIPQAEAVHVAERHRDQLLAAVEVLQSLPNNASDETYLRLQHELRRVAPDVEDSAWGHKYLSLLFPDRLDDFHVSSFQRYHLVRVLQEPPTDGDGWVEGRYMCAGRYVRLAAELEVSLLDLTTALNRRHGAPRRYWRVGTTDDDRVRRKYWNEMRHGSMVAIGWESLGDLSHLGSDGAAREELKRMMGKHYPSTPQQVGRSSNQLFSLLARMSEGDRVVAADGHTVLGIGEVAGEYRYDASLGLPHQRPVIWQSTSEWKPMEEGLQTTVAELKKPPTLVEIERRILEDWSKNGGGVDGEQDPGGDPRRIPRLTGVGGQLQAILERKGQAILYGPPGTGKTYWALRVARELASLRAFSTRYERLAPEQKRRIDVVDAGERPLVRLTSFHPEYGYEDFIEGYRPSLSEEGALVFTLADGIFRRLCRDAAEEPQRDFFLIIDEINRGDVPRIFGELLTLLERDKRGERVTLPFSGAPFHVPPNVHVIGTMNTADRSIALLDVALRRRFGFVEMMPDYSVLQGASVGGLPLGEWLKHINERIRATGGGDARNRQIGHAYLLAKGVPLTKLEQLAAVLRDDVVPLLEEYCYDDFREVAVVIGEKLVDVHAQRVRRELFEVGRGADLVEALSKPEIVTASGAVGTEEPGEEEGGEADEDENGDGGA